MVLGQKAKPGVQHFTVVDPAVEWKRGPINSLLRIRAIVSLAAGKILVSSIAFIYAHWIVGVLVLVFGGFCIAWLFTVRHYRIQRISTDNRLHDFCHQTRDDVAEIMNGPTNGLIPIQKLQEFHRRTVQRVAIFFRDLLGDETINCAIRIAEDVAGCECYVTKARSDRMDNVAREQQTIPLPAEKGLAHALRSHDSQGVLIINDIAAAAQAGAWMTTPNDVLPDVLTLMVAPINGWEASQKDMVGIFYVTSQKDVFQAAQTLPLKAIVDLLGMVYPIMFSRIAVALSE